MVWGFESINLLSWGGDGHWRWHCRPGAAGGGVGESALSQGFRAPGYLSLFKIGASFSYGFTHLPVLVKPFAAPLKTPLNSEH